MDRERYVLELCWYVVLNRVRAKTAPKPEVSKRTPEEALTETENQIIDDVLALLNKNG